MKLSPARVGVPACHESPIGTSMETYVFRGRITVQLSRRASVEHFRAGVGDTLGIVTLGPETDASWKMAGIDAFYLSLTHAERWGSRPIPEHTVAVLRTSSADQIAGYPTFIITGFLLSKGDPDTAEFGIPLLVPAILDAIQNVNASRPRLGQSERSDFLNSS